MQETGGRPYPGDGYHALVGPVPFLPSPGCSRAPDIEQRNPRRCPGDSRAFLLGLGRANDGGFFGEARAADHGIRDGTGKCRKSRTTG